MVIIYLINIVIRNLLLGRVDLYLYFNYYYLKDFFYFKYCYFTDLSFCKVNLLLRSAFSYKVIYIIKIFINI